MVLGHVEERALWTSTQARTNYARNDSCVFKGREDRRAITEDGETEKKNYIELHRITQEKQTNKDFRSKIVSCLTLN